MSIKIHKYQYISISGWGGSKITVRHGRRAAQRPPCVEGLAEAHLVMDACLSGEVKTLMIQLLRGVRHLHDNWILHRDLKTSNLLLSHKGILKVSLLLQIPQRSHIHNDLQF